MRPHSLCLQRLSHSDWVLARARLAACAMVCGSSRGLLAACHACMQGRTQVTGPDCRPGRPFFHRHLRMTAVYTWGSHNAHLFVAGWGKRVQAGTLRFLCPQAWQVLRKSMEPVGCWGALRRLVAGVRMWVYWLVTAAHAGAPTPLIAKPLSRCVECGGCATRVLDRVLRWERLWLGDIPQHMCWFGLWLAGWQCQQCAG